MTDRTTLAIPAGEFDAYLFDCDGTIADTMPLHFRAWREALAPWGCDFTPLRFTELAGVPVPRIVEILAGEQGLALDVARVARDREEAYFRFLPEIQAVPAVLCEIEREHGRRGFAVVSGSPRDSVEKTLRTLGLRDRFPVIVGAEDTARGKPHPDPYLLAAARLGVRPERCLVFEDAELGIQSAIAAGMSWVRVPSTQVV